MSTPSAQRTFLGQPWGLSSLFGIELWERFSYYGMQSLLAFYLYYSATKGGLEMEQATALSIVGAYGGFVYMTALAASFVSDRLLGPERTLYYSSILVMLGHIMLALIPGFLGLTLGLVSIALGSGGVKTTAQVVLGQLYSKEDPRREAGFSLFYLAINIGAFIGPMLTGWAKGIEGFHLGFGLAAIGMAIGLVQYRLTRKSALGDAGSEVPNPLPREDYTKWIIGTVAGIVVIVVVLFIGLVPLDSLSNILAFLAFALGIVLLVQMYRSDLTTAEEKARLMGYIPLLVAGVAFFAIFQSQFTIIAVYADKRTDLNFFGWEMEPSQVASFNPVFIIIFSAVFAYMWQKLGDKQITSPVKFGLANIIIGCSLFFFLPFVGGGQGSTPVYVLAWILFLFTMGELLLSPVGNSLATRVAPARFQSRMMAVWLMAVSMGTSLSGTLGAMYNPDSASAERSFFITLSVAAIVIGVIIIVSRRWVLKKFGGVR